VGVTRAQRSLSLSWCKKRKRARTFEERMPSRFIAELALEEAPFAAPSTLTPGERLEGLRALLAPKQKPELPILP